MDVSVFQAGFPVDGKLFRPLAYLRRVDPPDFGCEGRPDAGQAFGAVWGERADGPHFWRVPEAELLRSGLRDDVWLGALDGEAALVPADRSHAETGVPPALLDLLRTDGVR